MFCIVPAKIHLKREILVKHGKELNPNDDRYKQNTLMADSLHHN
jgi:hypothetical protein